MLLIVPDITSILPVYIAGTGAKRNDAASAKLHATAQQRMSRETRRFVVETGALWLVDHAKAGRR